MGSSGSSLCKDSMRKFNVPGVKFTFRNDIVCCVLGGLFMYYAKNGQVNVKIT